MMSPIWTAAASVFAADPWVSDKSASRGSTAGLYGDVLVTITAVSVGQERMEVSVALQHAATFHCHVENWEKWIFSLKNR